MYATNRKALSLILALTFGTLSLAGCKFPFGGDSEESSGGGNDDDSGGGDTPSALSQMVGTWRTVCAPTSSINSVAHYVRYQVIVNSSGSIWFNTFYYTTSNCSGGDSYTAGGVGSLNIGGSTVTPSGGNQIDITISGTSTSAYLTASANYLNSVCGSHWSGVSSYSTPVGGMTCSDSLFSQYASQTMVYNVVVLNGSSTSFSMGAFDQTRPGYASSASIPTSASLTFIKQ